MQYRYKVIASPDPEMLEDALNAAGEEGYGLVCVTPNGEGSLAAFMECAVEDDDEDEADAE